MSLPSLLRLTAPSSFSLFLPRMQSQQYQQQRRKFAAAFLAFIFILAAVDSAEAGKKEKPGKQQGYEGMRH